MVVARAIVQEEYTPGKTRNATTVKRRFISPRTYAFAFGFCLALFGVNAYLHGLVTASSARIETLAAELSKVTREAAEVDLEIAYLSSYPRIAREAETQLAMRMPTPGEYRFIAAVPSLPPGTRSEVGSRETGGLMASLDGWLRTFGRTEATIR